MGLQLLRSLKASCRKGHSENSVLSHSCPFEVSAQFGNLTQAPNGVSNFFTVEFCVMNAKQMPGQSTKRFSLLMSNVRLLREAETD